MTTIDKAVTRLTHDHIDVEGQRQLIASLTPEGLELRPKGFSKSRAITISFPTIWELGQNYQLQVSPHDSEQDVRHPVQEEEEDQDSWDRGYAQGQEDYETALQNK